MFTNTTQPNKNCSFDLGLHGEVEVPESGSTFCRFNIKRNWKIDHALSCLTELCILHLVLYLVTLYR